MYDITTKIKPQYFLQKWL